MLAASWGEPEVQQLNNVPGYELYNRNVLYCEVNRTEAVTYILDLPWCLTIHMYTYCNMCVLYVMFI